MLTVHIPDFEHLDRETGEVTRFTEVEVVMFSDDVNLRNETELFAAIERTFNI